MTKEKRILVVDDDDEWRKRVSESLAILGCEIHLASCRDEAEEMLHQETPYDLVICDNSMPRTVDSTKPERNSGIGLRASMRFDQRRLRDIPFILHSADETGEVERMIVELGGAFCDKSEDQKTLIAMAEGMLLNSTPA